MSTIQVTLEEEQRQLVLLALARLSLERPGWLNMCEETAMKMDKSDVTGRAVLFEEFRRVGADALAERLRQS